jgi:hypothetical protein
MKSGLHLASFLCLLVAVYLLLSVGGRWFAEWSMVDRCLDEGGSFDYAMMSCDQKAEHPYIPYNVRHPNDHRLALGSLVGVTVFGGLAVLTRRRRAQTAFVGLPLFLFAC